jgi:hypothetical protein
MNEFSNHFGVWSFSIGARLRGRNRLEYNSYRQEEMYYNIQWILRIEAVSRRICNLLVFRVKGNVFPWCKPVLGFNYWNLSIHTGNKVHSGSHWHWDLVILGGGERGGTLDYVTKCRKHLWDGAILNRPSLRAMYHTAVLARNSDNKIA